MVFDLACPASHVFEAWFGSTGDYDGQRARGLIACPICGSAEIAKAVMAPNVAPKGNGAAGTAVSLRGGGVPADPARAKAMLAALAAAQAEVLKGSEHVGARFAAEARAIHDGEAPERQIHGQATIAEAKALVADGVPVAPLPLPLRPPEQLQ